MSGSSVLYRFLDTPIARKAFNVVQHLKVTWFRDCKTRLGGRPGILWAHAGLHGDPRPQRKDELDTEEQFALLRLHSWLARTEGADGKSVWLDDEQMAYLRSFTSKHLPPTKVGAAVSFWAWAGWLT